MYATGGGEAREGPLKLGTALPACYWQLGWIHRLCLKLLQCRQGGTLVPLHCSFSAGWARAAVGSQGRG